MEQLQCAVLFIGILLLCQRTAQIPEQYHLIPGSMTWYEAQNFCRVKYTDLATVNNMNDKIRLDHALGAHVTNTWIGLQKGTTARWMWSDGSGPASFTRWRDDEPNNVNGDEWCAEMSELNGWNDVPCGEEKDFACYERNKDGMQRYVFYRLGKNWVNSQELCRSRHIDLASIISPLDHSEAAKVAKTWNRKLWIGLFNDAWMWSDGSQTSFRFWLSSCHNRGGCVSVAASQQGRWIESPCNDKAAFVCQGDLKVKRMVIRMMVRSDVNLTASTIADALLQRLETKLRQRLVTDFTLSWRSDDDGLVFQRHEPPRTTETNCP